MLRYAVLAVALGVAVPLSAADDLPDLGEASRAELSPQMEHRLGQSIMNDIRMREPSYVDDQEINDYLNALGNRLVEACANPSGTFHFFAIRDDTVNAFAMFGGYIGMNTGTIQIAQSESELASVLAHEIGHVTQNHLARQLAKEKQNTIPSMIAMAVGILAARSNTNAAMATVASAQAGVVQAQLAYSRDFEREADRAGYQTLQKAGFDVRSMGEFFERLQKASRLYENNAPVYLRSHPLTVERLSDMQNRAQVAPYRQVLSNPDFYLIRAKLRAQAGLPRDAVGEFEQQLRDKKFASLMATRYGLAVALMRTNDFAAAQKQVDAITALKVSSPMISGLAARVKAAAGDASAALGIYREALQRFPQSKSLVYSYADTLIEARQYDTALLFLDTQQQLSFSDYQLYGYQAKTYAALGRRLAQHRAQAEFYYLQGQLPQAIEQLQYAQKDTDGNFYDQSVVDARLRELRRQQEDEEKAKKNGG